MATIYTTYIALRYGPYNCHSQQQLPPYTDRKTDPARSLCSRESHNLCQTITAKFVVLFACETLNFILVI